MKEQSGYKKALQEFYIGESENVDYSLYQDLVQTIIPQQLLWILLTQLCKKNPQYWKKMIQILREQNLEQLVQEGEEDDEIETIIHTAFDDVEEELFKE